MAQVMAGWDEGVEVRARDAALELVAELDRRLFSEDGEPAAALRRRCFEFAVWAYRAGWTDFGLAS